MVQKVTMNLKESMDLAKLVEEVYAKHAVSDPGFAKMVNETHPALARSPVTASNVRSVREALGIPAAQTHRTGAGEDCTLLADRMVLLEEQVRKLAATVREFVKLGV